MEKSKIQVVYEYCHASQERLPTFHQLQHLKNQLERIEAKDVGIDEFGSCDSAIAIQEAGGSRGLLWGRGFSEITYIHIHECDSFSIGVFCLPAGKTFPLHDHPGMTVLSKLLYGSVYVKAYDWIKVDKTASQRWLAGRVVDGIMKAPQEASVLFPTSGGNIHGFTALTPCAILDVSLHHTLKILEGLPHTSPTSLFLPLHNSLLLHFTLSLQSIPLILRRPVHAGYAVLEAIPLPSDLLVRGAPYLGPPVVEQYCCSYQ